MLVNISVDLTEIPFPQMPQSPSDDERPDRTPPSTPNNLTHNRTPGAPRRPNRFSRLSFSPPTPFNNSTLSPTTLTTNTLSLPSIRREGSLSPENALPTDEVGFNLPQSPQTPNQPIPPPVTLTTFGRDITPSPEQNTPIVPFELVFPTHSPTELQVGNDMRGLFLPSVQLDRHVPEKESLSLPSPYQDARVPDSSRIYPPLGLKSIRKNLFGAPKKDDGVVPSIDDTAVVPCDISED